MKAQLKISRTLPFFDASAEVVDVNLFKVQVLDAIGVEVADLSTNQTTSAPNLYLSDAFIPQTLGQHQLYYKYNGVVIFHDTLDVGSAPISDYPIGTEVDLVLEDNIVGGPGQAITAHLLNSAGDSISVETFALFIGDQEITTFTISGGETLTFQVLPDPNATGAQTATFLCAPTVAVGGVAGNYVGTSAADTADYQIDGGVLRTLDLSAVAAGQANYIIALNAQLKGAYARDDGAGVTTLVTDSEGSDSRIILSNFGLTFEANTGLEALNYPPNGVANNVGNYEAVTFAEVQAVIETSITDGIAGDRLAVTQEASTGNLILTATSGVVGNASQIDLAAGTASILSSLGLTSMGTQGGNSFIQGSDGVSVQAPYTADFDGYVIQNITFTSTQELFVVWHNANVQTHLTSYLVTQATDFEVVLITAGSFSPVIGNNPVPHIGATVTVSTPSGVQIDQGNTDIAGDLRLELPPGDYVWTLSKPGFAYSVNNFKKEVYNSSIIPADPFLNAPSGATDTQAIQLITDVFAPTVTAPPAIAPMCLLNTTIYHMDGTPVRHATVHVGLVHRAQLFAGTPVFDTQRVYKTDSNGYVEFSLVQGIQVDISIAPLSLRRRIVVPSVAGPTNLMTLLSGADDPFDILTPNIAAAPKRTI